MRDEPHETEGGNSLLWLFTEREPVFFKCGVRHFVPFDTPKEIISLVVILPDDMLSFFSILFYMMDVHLGLERHLKFKKGTTVLQTCASENDIVCVSVMVVIYSTSRENVSKLLIGTVQLFSFEAFPPNHNLRHAAV